MTRTGAMSNGAWIPRPLQPVADLVLTIGCLQRPERRRLRRPLHRGLLQSDELVQGIGRNVPISEVAELVAHPGDSFPQRSGGAYRSRGRIVELVGQPGGQRTQGEQSLALTDQAVGVLHPEEQPLEQVNGHREPGCG